MVDKNSFAALLEEQMKLNERVEAARKREVQGVIKRVREAMQIYGLTAADFEFPPEKSAKRKAKPVRKPHAKFPALGSKKPAKYTDGKHTWAGGGSTPLWLREKLEQGHKLEDFLINKAA